MYPLTREDIESIMKEGAQAFTEGLDKDAVPYSKYTDNGRLWLRGYVNAEYGSLNIKKLL